MATTKFELGATVTCAETGKQFTIQADGCTLNCAVDSEGNFVSDEGMAIRNRRELLDRTKPFCAYVSGDAKHVTGWKGDVLGEIVGYGVSRSGWHGSEIAYFRVKDVHGNWWSGRGAGKGVACTLRPMKAPR